MFHLHSSRKKPETSKKQKEREKEKKPPVKTASVSSDLHVVIGVTEKGQRGGGGGVNCWMMEWRMSLYTTKESLRDTDS